MRFEVLHLLYMSPQNLVQILMSVLLVFQLYLVFGVCVCLAILGPAQKTYLWLFSCLHMLFGSPIWPAGISWMNCYTEVTGVTMILLNAGSSTAMLAFQYLIGWLFTHNSADDVLYLFMACAAAMCVQIIPMQIYASRRGNRYEQLEESASS